MIEQCKKNKELEKFQFYSVDPVDYLQENKDKKFDIITCMGLFEYLSDDYTEKLMVAITDRLSDNGILIATFPNYWSPYRVIDRFYRKITGSESMVPPYTPGVQHKEFKESETKNKWGDYGIRLNDSVYYNFRLIPKPFDKMFKSIDLWIARCLQKLSRSPLRFLATAMVLKGVKNV